MGAAGVVALAIDACRHCQQTYCGLGAIGRRSCFVGSRILGAMVVRFPAGGVSYSPALMIESVVHGD